MLHVWHLRSDLRQTLPLKDHLFTHIWLRSCHCVILKSCRIPIGYIVNWGVLECGKFPIGYIVNWGVLEHGKLTG